MSRHWWLPALLLSGCNPTPLDSGGASPPVAGAPLIFETPTRYAAGPTPHAVAIGDLDGDGIADLAVAGSIEIALLRGLGGGRFEPWSSVPSAEPATAIAAADLDGDGATDLVTAGRSLTIYIGAGDGTFQASQLGLPLDDGARLLAIADFNRDHRPDLVATAAGGAAILLGRGDGTFRNPTTIPAGNSLEQLVVADFDGDGAPDLAGAALDDAAVSIVRGHGDGTFDPPRRFAADGPWDLAAADLDGDGHPDLITLGQGLPDGTPIDVWLGHGDGTFGRSTRFTAPAGTSRVGIADLDGDGHPEAIAEGSFAGVTVFYSAGASALQEARFAGGPQLSAFATADLDGDGRDDLAVIDSGAIDVMLARPQRGLQSAAALPTGGTPSATAVADLDHDGLPDLVLGGSALWWVRGGQPPPLSVQPLDAGSGDTRFILATDLDGDRATDLILLGSTTRVRLGRGESAVVSPSAATLGAVGDFNGDRKIDLALIDVQASGAATVAILPGNGDGSFGAPIRSPAGSSVSSVAAADWNGDGLTDLATGASGGQGVALLLAAPDGTFHPPIYYAAGVATADLVAADLNGDTVADLALVGSAAPDGQAAVYPLLGIGDGSFRSGSPVDLPSPATSIIAADLNGDQIPDLALAGRDNFTLLGQGDGTFAAPALEVSGSAQSIAALDLDGDGLPDLATANPLAGAAEILWNRSR